MKYVRRFKRNRGTVVDRWREYRVLRPTLLEKGGEDIAGPDTRIKIAVPFPRAADKIFAGDAFYRRVLPTGEGRAERTRGRESRKIGARRMRVE